MSVSASFAPSSRPTRVRIAPSPTGDPHVGTAYIGLLWVPLVITFLFWQSAQYVPPEWWFED